MKSLYVYEFDPGANIICISASGSNFTVKCDSGAKKKLIYCSFTVFHFIFRREIKITPYYNIYGPLEWNCFGKMWGPNED